MEDEAGQSPSPWAEGLAWKEKPGWDTWAGWVWEVRRAGRGGGHSSDSGVLARR